MTQSKRAASGGPGLAPAGGARRWPTAETNFLNHEAVFPIGSVVWSCSTNIQAKQGTVGSLFSKKRSRSRAHVTPVPQCGGRVGPGARAGLVEPPMPASAHISFPHFQPFSTGSGIIIGNGKGNRIQGLSDIENETWIKIECRIDIAIESLTGTEIQKMEILLAPGFVRIGSGIGVIGIENGTGGENECKNSLVSARTKLLNCRGRRRRGRGWGAGGAPSAAGQAGASGGSPTCASADEQRHEPAPAPVSGLRTVGRVTLGRSPFVGAVAAL
ncbi:hypothetical protein EVAR_65626_1 [Eumeta japonica]|uniref:Uncharacterized protein n=1 Tax=Eumeta variegata TaxID=151549 RepID=A0A4C1Z6N1_EUMVA|nr:hypothetical protein EVAR_65626_1 [Eumeta japonica]